MARQQGAEVIDFEREDPVQALRWLTAGIGVDRAIDAVGVDAEHSHGTATPAPRQEGTSWSPGNAPAQAWSGRCRAWPRPAPCRSSASTPKTRGSFPSAWR